MITAKRATEEDFDSYFFLKCDEENIKWTGHENAPDREKLYKWFMTNINLDNRHFFLFFENNSAFKPIGYLYIDYVNLQKTVVDTGHGVHSSNAGKGFGTEIIKFVIEFTTRELLTVTQIEGWIAEDNIGSIKNVIKNGYKETDEFKVVKFEGGEEKRFRKFIRQIR